MKLLVLSDANSIHTQKWVLSLSERRVNLRLFSLFKPNDQIAKIYENLGVQVDYTNVKQKIKNIRNPNLSKIYYVTALPQIKKIINDFSPEIIHAHYASSYGILAFLTFFHPTILSVWGSDIYDFPRKNIFNKLILKKVINSTDVICSTSKAMKKIINSDFLRKDCQLIPFGVDTTKFTPSTTNEGKFTIGTIKSIESYNGIDCMIDAANILIHERNLTNIEFLIVGEGSLLSAMKEKCKKLNLEKNIKFTGYIPHNEIVKYFNKLSVFIAVSTRESFGVSILEAASCRIPAITSNIGGLPEVNAHNHTGFVIPTNNPKILSDKIMKFYNEKTLLLKMGNNARKRVLKFFDWQNSVDQMIEVYKKIND